MAKYRFKLLAGSHTEQVGTEENGDPIYHTYRRGDEFDSISELDRRLNSPGSIKFQRIGDETQGAVAVETLTDEQLIAEIQHRKLSAAALAETVDAGEDDGLDSMSVAQLKELADGDEIDLGNAKTKDAIIRVIRSARNAALV